MTSKASTRFEIRAHKGSGLAKTPFLKFRRLCRHWLGGGPFVSFLKTYQGFPWAKPLFQCVFEALAWQPTLMRALLFHVGKLMMERTSCTIPPSPPLIECACPRVWSAQRGTCHKPLGIFSGPGIARCMISSLLLWPSDRLRRTFLVKVVRLQLFHSGCNHFTHGNRGMVPSILTLQQSCQCNLIFGQLLIPRRALKRVKVVLGVGIPLRYHKTIVNSFTWGWDDRTLSKGGRCVTPEF